MRLSIAVSVLLLLPLATAAGQGLNVAPGARVRVTSNVHGYNKDIATVSQVRGDSVVLLFNGKPAWVAVSDLNQLQVSTGTRRTVGRNMMLGGLIGFVGGAVLGAATYEPCDGWCILGPSSASDAALWGGATLGVVGSVVGGVLGAFNKTDRWESVSVPARISVARTAKGGVAVSLSRSF